jgi:hypothetical protein
MKLYGDRKVKQNTFKCLLMGVRMGEGRNVYRVLMGKPKGKSPLERSRLRWEDGIKVDFREIGWGVWSGFTWLRIGTAGGPL